MDHAQRLACPNLGQNLHVFESRSKAMCHTGVMPYLAGLIKQLVLKFFDAEDILKHLVQLVLAEDQLGSRAGSHALLCLPRILIATVDGVKLGHPGAEHRLFAQTVDLRKAAHALLDVPLEHFPEIVGWEATTLDHLCHTVTLKKYLHCERPVSIVAAE